MSYQPQAHHVSIQRSLGVTRSEAPEQQSTNAVDKRAPAVRNLDSQALPTGSHLRSNCEPSRWQLSTQREFLSNGELTSPATHSTESVKLASSVLEVSKACGNPARIRMMSQHRLTLQHSLHQLKRWLHEGVDEIST
jgi:hypothetical protein